MSPITPQLVESVLEIVRLEVYPALGCTEPICAAFAGAKLREVLGALPHYIDLEVSGNLFKNAMAVKVPHTGGLCGLKIAMAMGVVCGDSALGLEVLKNATPQDAQLAKELESKIRIHIKEDAPILYLRAFGACEDKNAQVIIQNSHTQITQIKLNDTILFSCHHQEEARRSEALAKLSLKDIYDIAMSASEEQIAFIRESANLNLALSHEGLSKNYGLGVGRTYLKNTQNGLLPQDLQSKILIYTTAASDARMGGASLPAMSNSGSGNQGITATIPIFITAKHLGKEHLLNRALFLSHLTAIYIHSKLPKLSALCAVSTAGIGSYAGIAWLFTQDFHIISKGISTMVGDISGILCDGAAHSCSLKVATAIQSAYKSLLLALEDHGVSGDEGIVDHDVNTTIDNLCNLAKQSMQETDKQILSIMIKKHEAKDKHESKRVL